MRLTKESGILVENHVIASNYLQRDVKVDIYFPPVDISRPLHLLLINDGQNMEEMGLSSILDSLIGDGSMQPLLCVALHAGPDRKMEYGVAGVPDYLGRGAKAGDYTSFILMEVLPFIHEKFQHATISSTSFAGFSLGGLTAIDIVFHHPHIFRTAGVFSGSFWWRSVDQEDSEYRDDQHRIMQQQVRNGKYNPGQRYFLQCGNKDETRDRNNNGIIDSIDDTLDIVKELENLGYDPEQDIFYYEMEDGSHDIQTWARAMPVFLKWAYE